MQTEKSIENKKVVPHHVHKSQGLSAIWEDRTGSTITNPKQHKQLKRLKEALGMEKAKQLIDYILTHWSEFGGKYGEARPDAPFPDEPQIGFLSKYHALALVMLHEKQSLAAKKAKEEQAKKEALAKVKEEAATVKCSAPLQTRHLGPCLK